MMFFLLEKIGRKTGRENTVRDCKTQKRESISP